MPKNKLIPKSAKVPPLYSQEEVADPIVRVKLFTPCSSWTWLILEYDPNEKRAFGFCYDASYPDGAELGYISIEELESLHHGAMPAVERDLWFTPEPMSEAIGAECPRAR